MECTSHQIYLRLLAPVLDKSMYVKLLYKDKIRLIYIHLGQSIMPVHGPSVPLLLLMKIIYIKNTFILKIKRNEVQVKTGYSQ